MFSFLKKRKKTVFDRERAFAGIPVFSPSVTLEKHEGGGAVLMIKIKHKKSFFDRFRPAGASSEVEKKFALDAYGAFVADRVDGLKRVGDIVVDFEQNFKTDRQNAEMGVITFLKMLMCRGLVAMMIEKKETPDPPGR